MTARKRGRPSTLPAGDQHNLRCVVVGDEHDTVRNAMRIANMTQLELTRAAVLHFAREVAAGHPKPSDPVSSCLPLRGYASAGASGASGDDGDTQWVRVHELYPADAYLLRVKGRSMEGAMIADGDLIVVRPADAAEKGQLVVAVVDEGVVIKRLAIVPRGDRKGYWLESVGDHGAPPIRLDGPGDRRVVGIYIGLIRKT